MDRLVVIHVKVSTIVLLLLIPCLRATTHAQRDWNLRTEEDWMRLWNTERHVDKCNADLIPLFDTACQNDVRRITKKTGPEFIQEWNAKSFLAGNRRRRKRGLTEECCREDLGCVWEEIGEYCQMHGREKHENGSPVVSRRQARRRR